MLASRALISVLLQSTCHLFSFLGKCVASHISWGGEALFLLDMSLLECLVRCRHSERCLQCTSVCPCAVLYCPTFSSCRDRFHYYPNCAGLRALHSRGPCQSGQFLLGLEGHYVHLAVLTGVVGSASPRLEQVHPGRTWTWLCRGLEIQGRQRLLLCAFLISWLSGGASGRHSPLLRPYSVFHSNGKLKTANAPPLN